VEEVNSNDYSEVLIDADDKILESRDGTGKQTVYVDTEFDGDVEFKGNVTGTGLSGFATKTYVDGEIESYIEEMDDDNFSEVLIDDAEKMLESRDGNGKKTIYTDVEVKGQVTGDFIPEIEVKPGTDLVDAVVDAGGKTVEGTRQNGAKVFFGGIETEDEVQFKTSILYGKKWAVLGDSFTNGGGDNTPLTWGKYKGKLTVYPYIIGNRTGINVLKFFEGGQTLAFPAEPGDFTNSVTYPSNTRYYQNVPVDVDYITIYLGINDGNHSDGEGPDGEDYTGVIPLGTINDATTATYYGAWNVVLSWFLTNRPFAHIGIIVSNGCKNIDWVNAQIAIAKKWGIPYLNLNGDERCPAMIRSWNTVLDATAKSIIDQKQAVNYPSNTHPNQSTHIYESTFIENFLKTL
jgi:lysophospholipase L1-like esterase